MGLSTTSRVLAASACLMASMSSAGAEPTILGDYYEERVGLSCPTGFNCRISFARTPKDKFLTLQQVSCYFERSQPLRIVGLGEIDTPSGLTSRSIAIPFQANLTGNGVYYYSINQSILYKIAPKRYPFMSIETSAESGGLTSCTITGTLSNK